MNEKQFKIILIIITAVWFTLLAAACAAVVQVIAAHAAEPNVIMNGEYIAVINTQDDAVEIQEAPPINRISDALDEQDANGHHLEYLGEYYVTRFCSCRKCSGKWGTTSASGKPLIVNYSCASPLPFGTVVEIEGYGRCEVVDRTDDEVVRRTGGRIIDIYTSNHAEADEWGCRKLKVWKVE